MVFSTLTFFPVILPVFLAYFFPKCMVLLQSRSTMLTSALLNRLRADRPYVYGKICFLNDIAVFSPGSFTSMSDKSHFLNNNRFLVSANFIS